MNSALDRIKLSLPSARALSSFVSVSSGKRPTQKKRLVTWVRAICGVLWFAAIFIPACRFLAIYALFTSIGLVLEALEWNNRGRSSIAKIASRDQARRSLLDELDRSRASVGLERVLPPGALMELEKSATEWEQIDAMLATRTWLKQSGYQERVRTAADEYMMEILEAGVREGRRDSVYSKQARLSELLAALDSVDRTMFVYPRSSEPNSNLPLLPSGEIESLEAALG